MVKSRYLLTVVSQIDGGVRELYSRTAGLRRSACLAARASAAVREYVAEYVDVDVHGDRLRFEVAP